jgi:hypothetical protein
VAATLRKAGLPLVAADFTPPTAIQCRMLPQALRRKVVYPSYPSQHKANIQEQKDELRQETEDRAERARQSDARFNTVLGALQSLPGGNDPNAIVNAGAQQAAALRAIGDANAARQQQDAQMRLASQRALLQTTNQASNIVAAPTTPSQGSVQVVTSSPGAQSNVSNSNSSVASGAIQYSTPLASSCVRQFWDPKTYNWLSFENNCGQAIYVTLIFHRSGGWAMCVFRSKESPIPGHREQLQAIDFIPCQTSSDFCDSS